MLLLDTFKVKNYKDLYFTSAEQKELYISLQNRQIISPPFDDNFGPRNFLRTVTLSPILTC